LLLLLLMMMMMMMVVNKQCSPEQDAFRHNTAVAD
jgi:hypothetical protein